MVSLSGLTTFTALAGSDLFLVTDTSDTTGSANGTSKAITATNVAQKLPAATASVAGVMAAADKSRLDSLSVVKLNSGSQTSGDSFDIILNSGYKVHILEFQDVVPSVDGSLFHLQLRTSGGSFRASGDYHWRSQALLSSSQSYQNPDSQDQIQLNGTTSGLGTATGEVLCNGRIILRAARNSNVKTTVKFELEAIEAGGDFIVVTGGGVVLTEEINDAIRLLVDDQGSPNNATFASCDWQLHGIE